MPGCKFGGLGLGFMMGTLFFSSASAWYKGFGDV